MAEPKKMKFSERLAEQDVAEVSSNQANLAMAHRYTEKAIVSLKKEIAKAEALRAEIATAGDDEDLLKDYETVKDLFERSRNLGATI